MMDTALGPDKDFWPIANKSTNILKETSRLDQILTFIFVSYHKRVHRKPLLTQE